MRLATVPLYIAAASPFASGGVALTLATWYLLPARAFDHVEFTRRAPFILAVGATDRERDAVCLAFILGYFLSCLDSCFSKLVPSSFHESLKEIFFAVLELEGFSNKPYRLLTDE